MSKINAEHLARRACVYIRQSTPDQVQNNLESQRRQYALVERARALGWRDVEVIDEDQGNSASGTVRRGFERLLAALCDGQVGAVLSIEASRLARNGRDWHTLLEFCSVVDALIIDADGIYDPKQINDRLLLGMKGTISEMELASFRQRAQAALEQKARRGELFKRVPIGYVRVEGDRIEKDPDQRVHAALDLVFRKFRELASVRKLYMWLRHEQIQLPANIGTKHARQIAWKEPRYHALLSLLQNPIYAGVYAYGRTRRVVRIEEGRKRIVVTKQRRREDWMVFVPEHHDGYIDWDVYQSNQAMIAHNDNAKGALVRGAVRRGGALLSGLLRCGHCGAKIHAQYPGPSVIRYQCTSHVLNRDGSCCVTFGGLRADRLVAEQVLQCLKPLAVQAAVQALENVQGARDEQTEQKELALQQMRYEVARAQRQYDAVDPTNRLVATELERRWNAALHAQCQLEEDLTVLARERPSPLGAAAKQELLALAQDLPRLWDHPQSSPEHKKRILRAVLKDIVASSDGDTIVLLLHWQGGDHTALRFAKTSTGRTRWITNTDTVELIRVLARLQPDAMIASILNRLGQRTAHGESWTAMRICSLRRNYEIAVYREGERQARGELTVREAATIVGISASAVLRLIHLQKLPAIHACANAPWVLCTGDVERLRDARRRGNTPQPLAADQLVFDIQ